MISNADINNQPIVSPIKQELDQNKELHLLIGRLQSENKDLIERLKIVEQQLKQK